MATVFTSIIENVLIAKLKRDVESHGVTVTNISPKDLTNPTTVVVAEDGLDPVTEAAIQNTIDTHNDTQLENVKLIARNEFILGTKESGIIIFRDDDSDVLTINETEIIPLLDQNFGSALNRIGGLYAATGDFSGDVIIWGNFEVKGQTTTINTTELDVDDNIITLNTNFTTGTPTLDMGIEMKRGDDPSAKFIWEESSQKFKLGLDGSLEEIATGSDLTDHINDTANPHSVTNTQVGLGNVTNDAQLKRAANDFDVFGTKTLVGADRFIIEDSESSFVKKYITLSNIESFIDHTNIQNRGTNTHTQIDNHLASTANPHSVTKDQVGLGEVVNREQISVEADEFDSLSYKNSIVGADKILLEDSENSDAKVYTTINDLPFAEGIDGIPITGTPVAGDTLELNSAEDAWEYTENNNAQKIKDIVVSSTPPIDGQYLRYDDVADEYIPSVGPGIGSSGPIGSVIAYAHIVPPAGYLVCDGSEVSRTTYADLFAVIGETFGAGDGSTTFNLPDLGSKYIKGYELGTNTVSNTGGQSSHDHEVSGHYHSAGTLAIAMNPHNHSHTHSHADTFDIPAYNVSNRSLQSGSISGSTGTDSGVTGWKSASISINSDSHSHGVSDPGHSHAVDNGEARFQSGTNRNGPDPGDGAFYTGTHNTSSNTTNISINSDSHSHTISQIDHQHSISIPSLSVSGSASGTTDIDHTHTLNGSVSSNTSDTNNTTVTVDSISGSIGNVSGVDGDNTFNTTSSNNEPPHLVLNYVIKYSDNILSNGDQNISGSKIFTDPLTIKTHTTIVGQEEAGTKMETSAFQTLTSGTQTIYSFTPEDPSITWLEINVCARLSSTPTQNHYAAKLFGAVRRKAGAAVLVDSPAITEVEEGSTGCSVDLVVNGNDLEVQITAGVGIHDWSCFIRRQSG
jgi:microcystin-dependent protein